MSDATEPSRQLAAFAASLTSDQIPAAVREKARRILIDSVGLVLGGQGDAEVAGLATAFAGVYGGGDAPILGAAGTASSLGVAANAAVAMHALDYDDTHLATIIHPSCVVVPAGLAVAVQRGASVEDLWVAMVAGYEVMIRCGLGFAPAQLSSTGRLPTGVVGPIGAAVTAGKLLGLDAEAMWKAIQIAGSLAIVPGGGAKVHSVATAAANGLQAALLASESYLTPKADVLTGPNSIYRAGTGSDAHDRAAIAADLGSRWETLAITPKTYACCHSHQGMMDAMREIALKDGYVPEQVEKVKVLVPEFTWNHRLEPMDEKRRPVTPYASKFSIPFGIATVARHGTAGISEFTRETIVDDDMLDMVDRIDFELETEPFSLFPDYYSGWVQVTYEDGRTEEARIPHNRGSDANPLSEDDVRGKFDETAGYALTSAGLAEVWDALSDPATSVASLFDTVSRHRRT